MLALVDRTRIRFTPKVPVVVEGQTRPPGVETEIYLPNAMDSVVVFSNRLAHDNLAPDLSGTILTEVNGRKFAVYGGNTCARIFSGAWWGQGTCNTIVDQVSSQRPGTL